MFVLKPCSDFEPVNRNDDIVTLRQGGDERRGVEGIRPSLRGRRRGAEALAAEMGLVEERLEPILDILVAVDLLTRAGGWICQYGYGFGVPGQQCASCIRGTAWP